MKKSIIAVVLCVVMMLVTFAGCGELELDNLPEWEELLELDVTPEAKYSTSKEDYAKDINTVLELSAYAEDSEDDLDVALAKVKQYKFFTKEGTEIKNLYIEVLELSKEGMKLTECMTENNYEKVLEKMMELNEELDKIMNQDLETLIDDLLSAAKNAGMEAEDLQSLGLDF